jgi:Domain of unknown function (DUF5642)
VKLHPLCYLAVAVAVSVLPGCARSVDGTPVVARGPSSSASAQSVQNYDISRLSKLANEFPAGFAVQSMPVATLGPAADKFSIVGVGDVIAVDPPKCQSLLQPVHPPRDAQFTLVGGIGKGAIMVSAVKSPEPLPQTTASAGCGHAAVIRKIARRQFKSVVTRLPGPSIDRVTTTGSMDEAAVGGAKSYVFAGFLSDTVAVVVQGLLPGNPHADDILQDMLVKAVDAIRAG